MYYFKDNSVTKSIYLQFHSPQRPKATEFSKTTKTLIVNSALYKNYLVDYTKLTQQHTFMQPDIKEYPIFKNKSLLPLNVKQYALSPLSNRRHKTITNEEGNLGIKNIKKLVRDKNKKNKSRNIFKTNLHINCYCGGLYTLNGTLTDFKTQRNNNSSTYYNTTLSNTSKVFHENKLSNNNNNNLFVLSDIFFHDERYNSLVYNEYDIFHESTHQLNGAFIKERIEYYKSSKNENKTDELTRIFNNLNEYDIESNSYSEISLTLKSLQITFTNISNEWFEKENNKTNINNNKVYSKISFQLPLALLPLFYFKDFEMFKYILLSMISFENQNTFETFTINEEKLHNFLKKSEKFRFDKRRRTIFSLMTSSTNLKFDKEHQNQKGTHYVFLWSTPLYIYKVEIQVPQILVNFPSTKKTLVHFIPKEMMLYLMRHNFVNWDFYLVRNLFTYKKFRTVIMSLLSKKTNKYNSSLNHKQILIYITQPKIINYIDNIETKHNFFFVHTYNDYTNVFFILHSLSCHVMHVNKGHTFIFDLNQTQILINMSQFDSLTHFINKLLLLDPLTNKLSFNYSYFSTYNKELLLSIYKEPSHKKISNRFCAMIFINYPYLEKIHIENNEISSDTHDYTKYELKTDALLQMFEYKSKALWCKFLVGNEQEIGESKDVEIFDSKVNTYTSKRSAYFSYHRGFDKKNRTPSKLSGVNHLGKGISRLNSNNMKLDMYNKRFSVCSPIHSFNEHNMVNFFNTEGNISASKRKSIFHFDHDQGNNANSKTAYKIKSSIFGTTLIRRKEGKKPTCKY